MSAAQNVARKSLDGDDVVALIRSVGVNSGNPDDEQRGSASLDGGNGSLRMSADALAQALAWQNSPSRSSPGYVTPENYGSDPDGRDTVTMLQALRLPGVTSNPVAAPYIMPANFGAAPNGADEVSLIQAMGLPGASRDPVPAPYVMPADYGSDPDGRDTVDMICAIGVPGHVISPPAIVEADRGTVSAAAILDTTALPGVDHPSPSTNQLPRSGAATP
jgi:hypothetical protein